MSTLTRLCAQIIFLLIVVAVFFTKLSIAEVEIWCCRSESGQSVCSSNPVRNAGDMCRPLDIEYSAYSKISQNEFAKLQRLLVEEQIPDKIQPEFLNQFFDDYIGSPSRRDHQRDEQ